MKTWTRVGATALGTSILLAGPASAVATAGERPGPAPAGPPPSRQAAQSPAPAYVLPERGRTTARAESIRLLRLADTVQIA